MKRYYFQKTILPLLLIIFIITLSNQPLVNGTNFICGDMDNSNSPLNISDITYFISWLFANGPAPFPLESADCDGNGSLTISDLTCFIDYLFNGGNIPICPIHLHEEQTGNCLGNLTIPPTDKQTQAESYSSGCLDNFNPNDDNYMYAEFIGGDLHIYNINAYYNCCMEYHVEFTIEQDADGIHILAEEFNIGDYCYCMCYFNLEAVVYNLNPQEITNYFVTLIGIEDDTVSVDTVGVDTVTMGPYGYMHCETNLNSLYIFHDNAYLNCCPAYIVDYQIDGNEILAIERDTLYGCDCLCYFNLESVYHYLPTGIYIVTLMGGEGTPHNGQIVGVDTVEISVIGGPCSYNEFPGRAVITSVTPAPDGGCIDAVYVEFNFIPDDPNALELYVFPNWPDTGQFLTVGDGKHPNATWAELQGLTVGSIHPAIRMEISDGTCTPVIFKFLDVDYSSYAEYCY